MEVPAHPVERLIDTTGAGDLYAAGFLYAFTHGRDLETCARYGALAQGSNGTALLSAIAARRGFVRLGGLPDLDKSAAMFLNEYRTGLLGPTTLETP